MKYVSLDIETLGLDPSHDDVIEFAAVIDDFESPIEDLPKLHCYVTRPDNNYRGNAYAMSMHPVILRRIATREDGYGYVPSDYLAEYFADWLASHDLNYKIVFAGKNFGAFDMQFLLRLDFGSHVKIHHRSLDPGSMYFDPKIDEVPPDMQECLMRAGIATSVTHKALDDALDVIRLIRHKYSIPL